MYTWISSAILFSAAANAAAIAKRAVLYTGPSGSNTDIVLADDTVSVWSCTPQSIVDTLYANCYDQGFCNPEPWTMDCGDASQDDTITITVSEGQYQPWIKNGLVEAMEAIIASKGVTSSQQSTVVTGGGCTGCAFTATNIETYTMPASIGISHLNGAGEVPDVITLTIVNNNGGSGSGFCTSFTQAAAGVAGMINPVAGGIFTLASLVC